MAQPRFASFVDRHTAEAHGITVEQLHEPGTRVISDAPAFRGYRGTHILRLGETVLVAAPAVVAPFGEVLGPSQHAYLHRDDFVVGPTGVGRRIDASAAVETFRAAVGEDEYAEGGFGDPLPEVTWAVVDDDVIVAMGNMTDFAGAPADVGLVTLPSARGRGLATALAADMLASCFDVVDVARYRALKTNAASLAVAARLGFTPYGENIAIRAT